MTDSKPSQAQQDMEKWLHLCQRPEAIKRGEVFNALFTAKEALNHRKYERLTPFQRLEKAANKQIELCDKIIEILKKLNNE